MGEKYQYQVCEDCSVVLANGDMSAAPEGLVDLIKANVDLMGLVCPAGEIIDGYLDCWVCEQIAIDGEVWETV